ncbi:MAG: ABC transporter ATP-binding protein [Candidatus Eisenbacteria bacterium]|nr:ABC transporter ATP-binding protein [Candidatus Eisenbacteria bacterium]
MIDFSGVSFRYGADAAALSEISFSARDGERIVLLGSNGCGKTTLLKILDGLLFPREGRYLFDGRPVDERALRDSSFRGAFRRQVALLFQNPDSMLFHPTVRDEIGFGLRQAGEPEITPAIESLAASFGVVRLLGRSPFSLSGGEKQKVCLASLLSVRPRLLLLDEPLANLDPRSTGWLIDFLAQQQIATLTTTHNLSLAPELGDRALVLSEDHRLIYDGPIAAALGDRRLLLEANLMHIHGHRHEDVEHRHFHTHEWD